MKKKITSQSGQTLVTLIVFIMIFLGIFTMAITMMAVNSLATNDFQQGIAARQVAESGIEEALIRLLRNPDYAGETLAVGNGSVIITITGDASHKTIIAVGTLGNFQKKIKATITYNDIMTISSWQEEP